MTSLSRFQVVCESVKSNHHCKVLIFCQTLLCFTDTLVVQIRKDRAEFLVLRELSVFIAEPAKVVERESKLSHCLGIGFPVLDKLIVGLGDCVLVALVLTHHCDGKIGNECVLAFTRIHTHAEELLEVLFYTS